VVLVTEASNIDGPSGPKIIYVNHAFVKLTGYTKEEAIGQTPRILQGPKTNKTTLKRIKNSLIKREPIRVELYNYSKNGDGYWLDLAIIPLFDKDGNLQYFAAIERDVTQQQLLKAELEQLAEQDALTGILNRRQFIKQAGILFAKFKWDKRMSLGLLMLDVDNFKAINDLQGHQVGDACLHMVVDSCLLLTREEDLLCRFGGDELILLMVGVNKESLSLKANAICQNIREASNQQISVSIGGTVADRKDSSIDTMIARADQALYRVKGAKKGTFYIED
jgi:diguanylate cyclase (GGDEF)-like protein/PAS domain S-box-containing protein